MGPRSGGRGRGGRGGGGGGGIAHADTGGASDSDEDDYCYFGTRLFDEQDTYAASSGGPGARSRALTAAARPGGSGGNGELAGGDHAAAMRAAPVWEQAPTDAQGRRRFHGAFTGGFSAGYYNTVGSVVSRARGAWAGGGGQACHHGSLVLRRLHPATATCTHARMHSCMYSCLQKGIQPLQHASSHCILQACMHPATATCIHARMQPCIRHNDMMASMHVHGHAHPGMWALQPGCLVQVLHLLVCTRGNMQHCIHACIPACMRP
eukprot:364589-Chlamydomonas_euryale.AAC.2